MSWKNKKVLITGSEGFIGSHLTERLLELGADIRAFVLYNSFGRYGWLDDLSKQQLDKLEIFMGDIRDANNVYQAMEDVDIVFHLAALIGIPYSYRSPESYVATNVLGTLNVLQAARKTNIEKFIHTSTSEVYGTALYTPIDEKHPLQGQSPYSASKIGGDMIAESYYRSFDVPVAIIRPFNTYGPRQSARAIIPTIISQIANGKKTISLGSLEPIRDFTFVKDTVDGFIKVAEKDEMIGNLVNIGSGCSTTIGDLSKKIIDLMKADVIIKKEKERIRPKKSEVKNLICDNTKAKCLIGWHPSCSLETGLQQTITFIKNHLEWYRSDIYNI